MESFELYSQGLLLSKLVKRSFCFIVQTFPFSFWKYLLTPTTTKILSFIDFSIWFVAYHYNCVKNNLHTATKVLNICRDVSGEACHRRFTDLIDHYVNWYSHLSMMLWLLIWWKFWQTLQIIDILTFIA